MVAQTHKSFFASHAQIYKKYSNGRMSKIDFGPYGLLEGPRVLSYIALFRVSLQGNVFAHGPMAKFSDIMISGPYEQFWAPWAKFGPKIPVT